MILDIVAEAQRDGARLEAACAITGITLRTLQRWRSWPGGDDGRCGPHRQPANGLTPGEQTRVVEVMTSPAHRGLSPKQLVPRLADDGVYLASESTMYRLQRRLGLRRARPPMARTQVTRAALVHRATGPNQVWSWDITYLPMAVRGRFVYLYLVMDVWSRRIVGWQVHSSEGADEAATLITRICDENGVDPKGLVLHSDNGKPMRGNTMVSTLQWLGVIPSFSRPHVCNDNPYSESLFRTLKHTPRYPQMPFDSIAAAAAWVGAFVAWYNAEHRHSGIRFVTPDERHYGLEAQILAQRDEVYQRARRRRPERWSRSTRDWSPVGTVVLNPEPATAVATAA